MKISRPTFERSALIAIYFYLFIAVSSGDNCKVTKYADDAVSGGLLKDDACCRVGTCMRLGTGVDYLELDGKKTKEIYVNVRMKKE